MKAKTLLCLLGILCWSGVTSLKTTAQTKDADGQPSTVNGQRSTVNGQPATADFSLYFANNVTDVTDFKKITTSPELNWRQVKDGDIGGNSYEADLVTQMLASSRMKGLADQQQFWTMRDHSLLCFHIDDGDAKIDNTYEVELTETDSKKHLSITVADYFFVNVPLIAPPSTEYLITVTKVSDPTQRIRFKYTVYDWNDQNLYVFQLDRKRQLTGKNYQMEYVTGYMDEDGYMQKETKTLELKEKSFQSFYVPEGSDLLDVVLIGDENKLRIKKERLHRGIDIEDRYTKMQLSPAFYLDKHENREFINFNWLGSGLFEKYDTLFISLYDERSVPVSNATMNIEQVDENGQPTHSTRVKYLGYDRKMAMHKLLTMGKPAYIEILSPGKYPTVYKYPGAADEETGFVNEDRCSAIVTLKNGRWSEDDLVVSSTLFRNLHDERFIVVRNKVDHRLCSIEEMDLTGRHPADTITYLEDCGHKFPKLLDNKTIDRFAQIEFIFSRPKGGTVPTSTLTCTDIVSGAATNARQEEVVVIDANQYRSFSRDYYFVRYNLLDAVKKGDVARLTLTAGDLSYKKFPLLCSSSYNRDEALKMTEAYANENCTGAPPKDSAVRQGLFGPLSTLGPESASRWLPTPTEWGDGTNVQDDGAADGFADFGCDLKLPIQLKFNFRPVTVHTAVTYDFQKQLLSLQVNIDVNRGEDQRPNEEDWETESRQELKEAENSDRLKLSDRTSLNVAGEDVDPDRWINDEINDIFDMSSNHVGTGWFGGGTITLTTPIAHWSRFQLTEAAGYVGYGAGFAWGNLAKDPKLSKLKEVMDKFEDIFPISLMASFESNLQADFGVHSYDDDAEEVMNGYNMGYFFQVGAKAKAGLVAEIGTPDKLWGTSQGPKPKAMSFLFNAKLGVRFGGKLGGFFRVEGPFAPLAPCAGLRLVGVLVGQAYASLKLGVFHFNANAGFRLGGQKLAPDSNHNPFHGDFPYWLDEGEVRALGRSYEPIIAPPEGNYGRLLVPDVALDANPHFLSSNQIVYNDLRDPNDYNDDAVMLYDTDKDFKNMLSGSDKAATNHMRSKRGDYELVVYEQLQSSYNSDKVTDANALDTNIDAMANMGINAAIRVHGVAGQWVHTAVTDADGNDGIADMKPVVSVQDNGCAAVVYQHGTFSGGASRQMINDNTDGEAPETVESDDDSALEALKSVSFTGKLMLRTFDGKKWSEPTPLFDIDDDHYMAKYDVVMRGDTALVAATVQDKDIDRGVLRYASKSMHSDKVSYLDDELHVTDFFMKRVGQNAVIAMTYEATDSIRDIYVKTLDMDGTNDGRVGSDLGVDFCHPAKVKIICDRQAENLDDFAVLWTEVNNMRRLEDGGVAIDSMYTVLNASRIHLANAPQITAPITVGSEIDTLLVMTDFDGYLDDDSIKVVYTLGNIKTGAGIIMVNGKVFTNSFEHEVSFSREALRGSSTLPVNILIRNTGTSAIEIVEATINGEKFRIDPAYVAPLRSKTFTIQYPIPDNFDGYVTSSVAVDYNNVFRSRTSRGRMRRNLRRQVSADTRQRVTLSDIDCRVVSQSIEEGKNTFVVEVTDRMELPADMAVKVGIYAHPNSSERLSDGAEVTIAATDFIQLADARKAYATVTVDGITEPLQAYINAHTTYGSGSTDKDALVVANSRSSRNATLVNLFPEDDVNAIRRPTVDEASQGHKVSVAVSDDGATLSGLEAGEHIRIFAANGATVYSREAAKSTILVPLKRRGVYLLSAGGEIFKFRF